MAKELQLGNFIITREKCSVFDHLKIQAVSGIWNTKFRSDNPFYPILDEMLKNPKAHTHLHNQISISFMVANGLKDNQFLNDVIAAYQSFIERIKSANPPKEEDEKIIKEEREKYDTEK